MTSLVSGDGGADNDVWESLRKVGSYIFTENETKWEKCRRRRRNSVLVCPASSFQPPPPACCRHVSPPPSADDTAAHTHARKTLLTLSQSHLPQIYQFRFPLGGGTTTSAAAAYASSRI
jgi:hypothetical protein